ncbi:alpha/beta fold hydrolase [Oxynema sp. CENA135]|uniref:alpha/beta fold hydrolase n=1 Tax=Oxynema sp. CENA135 TaxID=984206 RepID=UPI00190DB9F6|nr:alpha/beta fold hydrolase [Oxynema sp. CENA135]
MKIEEKTIEIDGLKWFYRESEPLNPSDRPPVLLLHGLPSQGYSWTEVMPILAERGFRAIAPDWIGFGNSDQPSNSQFNYTPAAFLKALSSLIDALDLDRFYLVVQGFLGSVGVQYALDNGDRVERLVMLNSPVLSSARLPWKLRQLGLPFVGDMMTQDPLLVDRTLEGASGYGISEPDLDVYRKPFLTSSAAGRSLMTTIRRLNLKQTSAEIERGLREWEQPTLILWGLQDPWFPAIDAEDLAKLLPNSERVNLPEAGHYAQEHWSEDVGEAIAAFFKRQVV